MPPERNQKNRDGGFLPQELIESILARLPVKSLLRFKCVSKTWCTLISDPNPRFIKIFSHRFSQPPKNSSLQSHFIRCPLINMKPTIKLASEIPDDDIFLGSCNGLVCIGRPSSTQEIVLWNPATRLSKSLPHSTTHFGVARRVALGFGCNAKGDDFKVVRIFLPNSKKVRVGAEVYSSKDDSWTTIQVGYKFSLLKSTQEVVAKGNPYWVALDIDGVGGFLNLLGFDATTLDLNKIVPWPGDIKTGIFVDWKGFLGGIETVEHYSGADGWRLESIDVWIYNDIGDEKKWTRSRRFKGIELKVQKCLACSSSGKILGELANRKMFIFDTERNHVAVSELKRGEVSWFDMFPYNETLAYVKGMRPIEVSKHEDEDNADIGGFFLYSLGHISGRIAYKYAMEI